jgi:hypothetical protein
MLTILGTLLGGLFRLAPEWLKYLNGKQDRAHEVAMFDKQLEADKVRAASAKDQALINQETTLGGAEITAIIEATKAQGQQTGVKWVDAINALVRPVLTFWWAIILYTIALAAEFYALVYISNVPKVDAVLQLWGADEKAIVASIISFWFVDRALRKMSGR